MRYQTKIELEAKKALTYLNKLIANGDDVEITKKTKQRTIRQNAYLHVCITLFSIEFGYTLEEGKTHLKRNCPYHEFTRYEKKGEWFLSSTKDFTTEQSAMFIDWLREYSSKEGCYIPTSQEYLDKKHEIDREIAKNKKYL